MRKNPLQGLFKVRAKGRTYYYAFRGGPRIEAEPGTAEFLEEYLAARSPDTNVDRSRFGAWVSLYKSSDKKRGGRPYKALSDSTKRNWAPMLDNIKAHFGSLSVRQFDQAALSRFPFDRSVAALTRSRVARLGDIQAR